MFTTALINHIHLGFAGIGPMIWHWGVGVGLIIILVLVEVFSGAIAAQFPFLAPFLQAIQKHLLWAAAAIAIFLGGEALGVHDEANRCAAKATVVETVVNRAVGRAHKPAAGVRDRWDRDGQ